MRGALIILFPWISGRIKSFAYAFKGIRLFLATQPNARIQIAAATGVIGLGLYMQLSGMEWLCLSVVIGLVFIAEIFNTALEYLADFVSPDFNEHIGKVKDLAAAGVLMSAILSLVVGALIFIPKIYPLLKQMLLE